MRKFTFERAFLSWLLIALTVSGHAQSLQKIKGKITDNNGTPIAGASIQLEGEKRTVMSEQDGSFTISAPPGGILRISAVGYTTKQISFSGNGVLTVTLSLTDKSMSEVVVTALGVKREKRNLTFSSQELKSDELLKAQEPNMLNAMAGKVSGMQITSSSGAPGGASAIVIRGITSLTGNNQALIVLDGVPINNDETDGGGSLGAGSNRLSDIDPAIIESVNILKGASATALYGSAGARGVVLITTKAGSRNATKPTITVSSGVSFETPNYAPKQLTYAGGYNGAYIDGDSAKSSYSWGPRIDTLYYNGKKVAFHNPQKDFFKTGVTNNNTVSIAGGSPISNYFVSYSYFDQTGTVPNTSLDRHSFFTKFQNKITENLTITSELTYVNSKNLYINQGYSLQNPLMMIYAAPISYNMKPYLNADGTQRYYRYYRDNPYWIINNIQNTSAINRFLPVVNLSYNPLPWLSITERIGADIYIDKFNYHVNKGDVTYADGQLINKNETFKQFNHDLIIQARRQFGKFNTSLLLGNNLLSTRSDYTTATGTNLTTNGYYNIANAATITYTEDSYLSRKVGYYSQAEVDYDRLFILSLTGRVDGTSVLTKTYYPYGSAALGFIWSELLNGAIKNTINFGKLRASYAIVGNDNVGAYATITPYTQAVTNVTFPYSGQNGFLVSTALGNPYLKNELQKEFEIGLETKFFNNRAGFEASYFDRRMSNGLVQGASLANSTGYSSTTLNSARIRTQGIELLFNVSPIKTKDFSWDIAINYTKLNTKVLAVAPGLDQTYIGATYAVVGKPYGMIYGSAYARNASGELLLNGGLPYTDTNRFLGTATPRWSGGINNEFHYKQFALSFFFDTRQGGVVDNVDEYYDLTYGTSKATEHRQDRVVKGIDASTGSANKTSVSGQSYYTTIAGIAEAQIQDASFIKLRNVSFSYNLNHSVLLATPFKDATFTITGRNLWIHKASNFTGSDPESNNTFGTSNGSLGLTSYGTPTSKSIGCSLKLVF